MVERRRIIIHSLHMLTPNLPEKITALSVRSLDSSFPEGSAREAFFKKMLLADGISWPPGKEAVHRIRGKLEGSSSLSETARLHYLLGVTEKFSSSPESIAFPPAKAFEFLKSLAKRTEVPLNGKRLEQLIKGTFGSVASVPHEFIQGADQFSIMFARLVLGDSYSAILQPWSDMVINRPSAEKKPMVCPQEMNLDLKQDEKSLPDESGSLFSELATLTKKGRGVLKVASRATGIFSCFPPVENERLYSLCACAALFRAQGIHSLGLKVKSDLETGQWVIERSPDVSPAGKKLLDVVERWESRDQMALSFLLSVPDTHDLSCIKPDLIAEKAFAFFERVNFRPFGFDDLVSAGVYLCAIEALSKGAEPGHVAMWRDSESRVIELSYTHGASFSASYLNERDLKEMGVKEPWLKEAVLKKVTQAKELGFAENRLSALNLGALLAASAMQGIELPEALKILSGSELKQFLRMLKTETLDRPSYFVDRYSSFSRQQFCPDTPDQAILEELEKSGNYPALLSELALTQTTLKEVCSWLKEGKAYNLVELESFCESLQKLRHEFSNVTATLKDTIGTAGSGGTYAVIRRKGDNKLPKIAICMGYQAKEHVGFGLRHILHQRGKDGVIGTGKDEDENLAIRRFVDEVLFHVGGTARVVIPSRKNPESQAVLSGEIENRPGHFLTLVLASVTDPMDKEKRSDQVVTAIYHPNVSALRRFLRTELAGLYEKYKEQRALKKPKVVRMTSIFEAMSSANKLLVKAGAAEISEEEIGIHSAPVGLESVGGGAEPVFATSASIDDLQSDIRPLQDADMDYMDQLTEPPAAERAIPTSKRSLTSAGEPLRAFSFGDAKSFKPQDDVEQDYNLGGRDFFFNPAAASLME